MVGPEVPDWQRRAGCNLLSLVDPLVPKVAAAVDFISKLPGIVLLPPKIVLTEMQEMEPRPYRNVASLHFLMVIISC